MTISAATKTRSREGFCTTTVHGDWERAEVREPAAVYRLRRIASG